MSIEHPVFLLPTNQIASDFKPGGGGKKFYGDKNKFEAHKRVRVTEIDQIMQNTRVDTALRAPKQKVFFSLEFEKGATSKSQQPTSLLDKFNIDIETQKTETTFYASTDTAKLAQFRAVISGLTVDRNKDDAASLSAIKKISTIPAKSKLKAELSSDKNDFVGFLYLHTSLSDGEAKEVFESVKELQKEHHEEAQAAKLEYFVSPSKSKIIYGTYSRDDLGQIIDSSPVNPIMRFEESQTFIIPSSIETYHVMDGVEVVQPELDAVVAVLDTGMAAHDVYKDLLVDQEDYRTGRSEAESSHGTLVGSRVMFGNNIQDMLDEGNRLFAQSKVLDCRVIGNQGSTNDRDIIDSVGKILDKHSGKIKVYNLSFNNSVVYEPLSERAFITRELDALAHQHNVLLVCSAGNCSDFHKDFANLDYPDCILSEGSVINPPADGVNVISVGAIADAESSRSLAKNNEPSPFTRHGLEGLRKPDLVHYGGNLDKHGRASGIGIEGLSHLHNKIAEDAGTSFSAPLVSQAAAKLFAYLESTKNWKERPVALTKALLLHSAYYELPSNSTVPESSIRELTGFGIPDYQRALDASFNAATFITTGIIGEPMKNEKGKEVKASKQKIKFTVPDELQGKNKKVKVKGTLVYLPPVSASGGVDYANVTIEANLHYINSNGTMQAGKLTEANADYRVKWNPVQSFEKIYQAFEGGMWEIWLSLTTRGSANALSYVQDYALVITIEDVSPEVETRVNIQNVIETKHKQYVRLTPKVSVKQPLRTKV